MKIHKISQSLSKNYLLPLKKKYDLIYFMTIFAFSLVVYKNLCDAPYMESHNDNMSLLGRYSLSVLFNGSIKNARK